MATNPNQSAARTRAEESVHDDLENVSALILGDEGPQEFGPQFPSVAENGG